jgi:hypothetical protein
MADEDEEEGGDDEDLYHVYAYLFNISIFYRLGLGIGLYIIE